MAKPNYERLMADHAAGCYVEITSSDGSRVVSEVPGLDKKQIERKIRRAAKKSGLKAKAEPKEGSSDHKKKNFFQSLFSSNKKEEVTYNVEEISYDNGDSEDTDFREADYHGYDYSTGKYIIASSDDEPDVDTELDIADSEPEFEGDGNCDYENEDTPVTLNPDGGKMGKGDRESTWGWW